MAKKEDISKLIILKLKQAREDIGMTLEEAARAFGFNSHQILLNIEKGERSVKVSELVKFAKLYERKLDFFLDFNKPVSHTQVLWRDKSNDSLAKRVEQKFLNYCETYARLEQLANRKPMDFVFVCGEKMQTYDEAISYGENLCKSMELGSHPTQELSFVLENRYGVKILIIDAEKAGSAASAKGSFGTGILLNRRNSPWRRNYDIAHELFHLTTWEKFKSEEIHCTSIGKKPLVDKLADAFASALLLPSAIVIKTFWNRVKNRSFQYIDCVTMAREFGVSSEALLWRLVNLNLIYRDSAKQTINSSLFRNIDRTERSKDWSKESESHPSSRFVAIAFECLQQGKLSRAKFAELVEIDLCDIEKFLSKYGYSSEGSYEGKISTT